MNSSDYYQQKIYLAKVDKNNVITGKVERWHGHKDAILHRGYTVILTYQNQYLLQHRKHPVFNKCFDLSFSSHQIYINNNLQTDLEAIADGLYREWNISEKDLIMPLIKKGQIYYQAKDPDSDYFEHEIDMIYQAELRHPPKPNLDYCFGYRLIENREKLSPIKNLTPWVGIILQNNLVK